MAVMKSEDEDGERKEESHHSIVIWSNSWVRSVCKLAYEKESKYRDKREKWYGTRNII